MAESQIFSDEYFMKEALKEAEKAGSVDEVPAETCRASNTK